MLTAKAKKIRQTCEFLQTSFERAFVLPVATTAANTIDTIADAA